MLRQFAYEYSMLGYNYYGCLINKKVTTMIKLIYCRLINVRKFATSKNLLLYSKLWFFFSYL